MSDNKDQKPGEQVSAASPELSQEELDKVTGGNVISNIVQIAKSKMAQDAPQPSTEQLHYRQIVTYPDMV
jgi:hypothetical protein